jgi:hypothetical protein
MACNLDRYQLSDKLDTMYSSCRFMSFEPTLCFLRGALGTIKYSSWSLSRTPYKSIWRHVYATIRSYPIQSFLSCTMTKIETPVPSSRQIEHSCPPPRPRNSSPVSSSKDPLALKIPAAVAVAADSCHCRTRSERRSAY